jgi:hypothetical protein
MGKRRRRGREYYVYILYRPGTRIPFYVGKGCGDRWLVHEKYAKRGRSYKDNIICKAQDAGQKIPKCKIKENLTWAEAYRLEEELIKKIGREPNGPLVNQTLGGEGVRDPSDYTRKVMGKAQSKRYQSEEQRRIASEIRAALWRTPEFIANVAVGFARPDVKAKMCKIQQDYWAQESERERMRISATERMKDPKARKHLSKKAKERWAKPGATEKLSASLKAYLATPEGRTQRSISSKKGWAKISKKQRSISARKGVETRRKRKRK